MEASRKLSLRVRRRPRCLPQGNGLGRRVLISFLPGLAFSKLAGHQKRLEGIQSRHARERGHKCIREIRHGPCLPLQNSEANAETHTCARMHARLYGCASLGYQICTPESSHFVIQCRRRNVQTPGM